MDAGTLVTLLQNRMGGQYDRNRLREEIRHTQNEILALPETPFCRKRNAQFDPMHLKIDLHGNLVTGNILQLTIGSVVLASTTYATSTFTTLSALGSLVSAAIPSVTVTVLPLSLQLDFSDRSSFPAVLTLTGGLMQPSFTLSYGLDPPYRMVTSIFQRSTGQSSDYPSDRPAVSISTGSWRTVGDLEYFEKSFTFACLEAKDPMAKDLPWIVFGPEFDVLSYLGQNFYMDAYTWPVQPTADSVMMDLPDQWLTSLLYYAVKKRVEESAYGVDIYNSPEFKALLGQFQVKQTVRPTESQGRRKGHF